jgi:putative peptide zinc metalloprotease protein
VNGAHISAGTVVGRLENPDFELRLYQIERRIAVLRYELAAVGFEETFRSRIQAITRELDSALAEHAALNYGASIWVRSARQSE